MNKEELLLKAFYDARQKVADCGIDIGQIYEVTINTRINWAWGLCGQKGDGFKIEIAECLVNEDSYDDLLNTMIHEILHACKDAEGHGKVWKKYAQMIKEAYGIEIKRTNDKPTVKVDEARFTHKLICTNCNHTWLYTRSCYAVRKPEKCTCPYCKQKAIRRCVSPKRLAMTYTEIERMLTI